MSPPRPRPPQHYCGRSERVPSTPPGYTFWGNHGWRHPPTPTRFENRSVSLVPVASCVHGAIGAPFQEQRGSQKQHTFGVCAKYTSGVLMTYLAHLPLRPPQRGVQHRGPMVKLPAGRLLSPAPSAAAAASRWQVPRPRQMLPGRAWRALLTAPWSTPTSPWGAGRRRPLRPSSCRAAPNRAKGNQL